MVPELLPGGGPLNGRRWAGQQLLQLWMQLAQGRELPLLVADSAIVQQVQDLMSSWNCSTSCRSIGFASAAELSVCGGLLVLILRLGCGVFGVMRTRHLRHFRS